MKNLFETPLGPFVAHIRATFSRYPKLPEGWEWGGESITSRGEKVRFGSPNGAKCCGYRSIKCPIRDKRYLVLFYGMNSPTEAQGLCPGCKENLSFNSDFNPNWPSVDHGSGHLQPDYTGVWVG